MPCCLERGILKQLWTWERWWQQTFGTVTEPFSFILCHVVWWWLQSLVGHVKKALHVGGLALLPELWCCCAIIQGYILLTPPPLCWTPGMATLCPSTVHSWLGLFEFPHVWNLKKLLGGWRFTPLYCVKGKVKKWLGDQDISFYCQGLRNLIIYHDTYL